MILRHAGLLILFSLIVLIIPHALYAFLHAIDACYHWIGNQLLIIFTTGTIGDMIRHLIAILLIPSLVCGLPAGAYWIKKRRHMPYAAHVIWVSWIIQAVAVTIFSSQVLAVANPMS